jgi:hypothetical protein
VRLDHLRQVQDLTEHRGRLGDPHREDGVARLGRGDEVAHWADAADACHERRHLVERPPLAELLEAAELGYVKSGVGDVSGVVEPQGDLRVAFDAGDGVDGDRLSHGVS